MNTSITTSQKPSSIYDQAINYIADAFIAILAKKIPFYQVHQISLEKLNHCYTTAYNLYNSGKYEKAKNIFTYLTFNCHSEKKSWVGLAACCQMLKQYPQAIATYSHVKMMDPSDPVPSFHSFNCYMELKKYPEALASLEVVILRSLNKPEYADLKQQAENLKLVVLELINEK